MGLGEGRRGGDGVGWGELGKGRGRGRGGVQEETFG